MGRIFHLFKFVLNQPHLIHLPYFFADSLWTDTIYFIASSIDILDRRLGDNIPTFIFSAWSARIYLDKLISAKPHLSEHIIVYDQPFNTFEDRVEPFKNSDILLYPSRYSGWGLVIPEALAAGLPVISTTDVESARYYVSHGYNGILIRPTVNDIVQSLLTLSSNPSLVDMMSSNARAASNMGSALSIAKRLSCLLKYVEIILIECFNSFYFGLSYLPES